MQLALVIITHNSAAWLPALVTSWNATRAACADLAVEILLADCGSTDDTLALAQALLPEAHIFPLTNVGFGAAANLALRNATAHYALLCNPDLEFPREFLLQLLMRAPWQAVQPDHSVAIIAPRLLNPDGTAQPSVGSFPTVLSLILDQFRRRARRKYCRRQPRFAGPVAWASGPCLLMRREHFLAVGGFDEKYFLYVEEVDLQRRLKDAGHTIWFLPEVAAIHHQPNAKRPPRPEIQRYAARGLLRYFAKFGGGLSLYRVLAFLTGRLGAREAFASRQEILERPTGP